MLNLILQLESYKIKSLLLWSVKRRMAFKMGN